ncbi:g10877 [Coccomyxa elongata]
MLENGPSRWMGPPAPKSFSIVTRVLQLITLILVAVWVLKYLGGVALTPKRINLLTNDTGGIFNWHPLLMTLAFPVLMGEAVLAYRAPVASNLDRDQRKLLHALLQIIAVVAAALGLVAAFQSHNLKKPMKIPNVYSAHSYLGIFTVVFLGLQFILGFTGFLYPKYSKANRESLAPYHIFLGRATFILGLATMAAGIQEKTQFVSAAKKLSGSGLYSGAMSLPAVIEIFLALVGLAVMYHHVPGPSNRREGDTLLPDVLQDA